MSIEKGRQSRFAFEKFLNIDHCLLLFCIMNIFLSLLYYDADFKGKKNIAGWCLTLCDLISIVQSKLKSNFSNCDNNKILCISIIREMPKNINQRIDYT